MGLFKKLFKGIGKFFKKIGKGIKKAFKAFGKFMGKIGPLGSIAMMFILPGIGSAISGAFKSIIGQTAAQAGASAAGTAAAQTATQQALAQGASAAASKAAGQAAFKTAAAAAAKAGVQGTASGLMAGGTASQALGNVLQFAGKVASMPGKVFSSITQGVTNTLTEFTKTAAKKLGMDVPSAAQNFFGDNSAFTRVSEAVRSPFDPSIKAKRLFEKEGLTYDPDKLLEAAEAANEAQTATLEAVKDDIINKTLQERSKDLGIETTPPKPKSLFEPITKDNIDDILGEVSSDPKSAFEPITAENIDKTLKGISDPVDETLKGAVTEEAAEKTFTQKLKDMPSEIIEKAGTKIRTKIDKAKDPFAIAQAAVKTAQQSQEIYDPTYYSGEVIDVGYYQDPGAFQLGETQNVISPITTFQGPQNYYRPLSSWAQQFVQQPMDFMQPINVGEYPTPNYNRGF